ncbi:hypothetical protein BKA62DRAFT_714360 [Auriculariales sp. MPI-PUGE-AT-0066]|nr:hypothetical protein BKA62DRAFT_714360 [Auriculariales sp. MPI-PUGE-AT-0066]
MRLTLSLLPESLASRTSNAMNGDAPHLASLSIRFNQFVTNLPSAPNLPRLSLGCGGSDFVKAGSQLSGLKSLITFFQDQTVCEVLAGASCSNLVTLCIPEDLDFIRHEPSGSWQLPHLTSLVLNDAALLIYLHAPRLHQLALDCFRLDKDQLPTIPRFATARHLCIYSLSDSMVNFLAGFYSIEQLSSRGSTDCSVGIARNRRDQRR